MITLPTLGVEIIEEEENGEADGEGGEEDEMRRIRKEIEGWSAVGEIIVKVLFRSFCRAWPIDS